MWSDNETTLDLINVQHLMSAVTGIVRTETLLPITIGVFGDWGSGKSSIMRMAQSDLEKEEDILCISFNGWRLEGYEDAKAALMGTILDSLREQLTLTGKALELVKALSKRVNWFGLMGMASKKLLSFTLTGLPGLSADLLALDSLRGGATALREKLEDFDPQETSKFMHEAPDGEENLRQSVRQFREDFAQLLNESQVSTLVVFIDDLDRCLPHTVIETLEAIRLFLFVPNTAFIIGADEKLVYHAVKQRFPEIGGSTVDVGRDYLEKLVQIPVRIPPLSQVEVETYINLLFAQLHLEEGAFQKLTTELLTRAPATIFDVGFNLQTAPDLLSLDQVPSELADNLSLAQQITDVLTTGLEGNPRQIKRFLNMLLLRLRMAKARQIDLSRRVLAKLMLLEYFKPESFRLLAQWQALQDGEPDQLRALERQIRGYAARAEEGEVPNNEDHDRSVGDLVGDGAQYTSRPQANRVIPTSVQMTIPNEAKHWLEDDWFRNWLTMEPALNNYDLRPYFYFAREQIGIMAGAGSRLSRPAREALELFISPSDAQRRRAIKRAESLTEADAAGVFQALANRVLRSEDLGTKVSPLDALLSLIEKRHELMGESVALLGRLNRIDIPSSIPLRVYRISRDTSAANATIELLNVWSRVTDNTRLAFAARKVLDKNKR